MAVPHSERETRLCHVADVVIIKTIVTRIYVDLKKVYQRNVLFSVTSLGTFSCVAFLPTSFFKNVEIVRTFLDSMSVPSVHNS